MLPNIQERVESLSQKRRQMLRSLENCSADKLLFKAGSDKWSAVEAMEHLVVVEDNFMEQVSANIPVSSLDPQKRSPEKYQVVLKVMRGDVEVDVPHESMEPRGGHSFTELVQRWDGIREDIRGMLEGVAAAGLEELVYLHPFGGPLTIAEALEFLEAHFDNHARHMDVILARAK